MLLLVEEPFHQGFLFGHIIWDWHRLPVSRYLSPNFLRHPIDKIELVRAGNRMDISQQVMRGRRRGRDQAEEQTEKEQQAS